MEIKKTLAILAGGTGGHIYPALSVAKRWRAQGGTVVWLGTVQGLEAKIVPEADIPFYIIQIAGVRGRSLIRRLLSPFHMVHALWQSLLILRRLKPDVVLGMGGYVSGPAALAAKCLGIPLVIHEQNAIAGKTNAYLTLFANKILQAFEGSIKKPGVVTVGNPVRTDIAALSCHQAIHSPGSLNILVLGGSRGAKTINTVLPSLFSAMPQLRLCIKHQAGVQHFEEAVANYAHTLLHAEVLPYIEDMAAAYAWADLVIARAGAMTVFEVMAAGVPAIFIPYPYAVDDHQAANARYLVGKGAAYLCREHELSLEYLGGLLEGLYKDPQRYGAMSKSAYDLRIVHADQDIVDTCATL